MAIDEAVTLQDCEVYSYKSDGETDPFGEPHSMHSSCFDERPGFLHVKSR